MTPPPARRDSPRSKKRSKQRRGGARPAVPNDLGPVAFAMTVDVSPRVERSRPGPRTPTPPLAGGLLTDLGPLHARGYRGTWTVRFGDISLGLQTHKDLGLLEEFWVLMIELVDSGYGEWSLEDERGMVIVEAQVFGPDVRLEFSCETGSPRFRGRALPKSATVRLRAMVEAGCDLLDRLVTDVVRVEASFGERPELAQLKQDAGELRAAVAELPAEFRKKVAPAAPVAPADAADAPPSDKA